MSPLGALRGALCALVLAPAGAGAEAWRVEDALSSLAFSFVINGVEATGVFPRFEGAGRFDPAAPEDSALELVVDVSAVDMGNAVASHFARSADWFWAEAHPLGVFRLERVERGEEGADWTAHGTLELRGVSQVLSTPLALELGEDRARASGAMELDRHLFGIGRGPSAALVSVEDTVRVTFDLVAEAAPAPAPAAAAPAD